MALLCCEDLIQIIKRNVMTSFIHLQQSKLRPHENVCRDYDCCHVVMSLEGRYILKYNQEKNPWTLHSLYMPTQNCCLKKFIHGITIQKNLPQEKEVVMQCVAIHYSPTPHLMIKNKDDFYRGFDCIIKSCTNLKKACSRNKEPWKKRIAIICRSGDWIIQYRNHFVVTATRVFFLLMIAMIIIIMIIAMAIMIMEKLLSEHIVVTPKELMMLMMIIMPLIMIEMIIVIKKKLWSECFIDDNFMKMMVVMMIMMTVMTMMSLISNGFMVML